jgi:apolipoprotein D and lipocalin family protein
MKNAATIVDLVAVITASLSYSSAALAVNLDGVANFDPERFLGMWYQIQSTNPFFQRGCLCAKADYSVIDEKTIRVENTCVGDNNQRSSVRGKAVIKDPEKPSRLSVSFSPISFGRINYVVTEVGENYEYAVIVSPGNSPIWILARDKELPASILSGIRLRLIQAGVKVHNLKDSSPLQCSDF